MYENRERSRKVVSEDVKRHIVSEIESGNLGQCEASRFYEISRHSIQKWLKRYGKIRYKTTIVEVVMKDEKDKIEELKQALADAHLKMRIYDKMFEIARQDFNVDIKKKYSMQASELLKKKDTRSDNSAE